MARTKLQARLGLPRVDPICQGIKRCGDRCTNRKRYGDFCGVHTQKEECPVCYDTRCCERLKCGHGLCMSCSSRWFATKTTCPMCREVVREPAITFQEELEQLEAFALRMAVRRSLSPSQVY